MTFGELRPFQPGQRLKCQFVYLSNGRLEKSGVYYLEVFKEEERGVVCDVCYVNPWRNKGHRCLYEWHEKEVERL